MLSAFGAAVSVVALAYVLSKISTWPRSQVEVDVLMSAIGFGPLWALLLSAALGTLKSPGRRQPTRPRLAPTSGADGHPQGMVRLGWVSKDGYWLDLAPARDFARHVTLLGTTGSGKTTTIGRIAEGVLQLGWAVLIVDAKGGSLRASARGVAEAVGATHSELVPGQPDSLHYNPCRLGSAAQVANKLVGAFAFGPEAEIYKNVGIESLSVLIRAARLSADLARLRAAIEGSPGDSGTALRGLGPGASTRSQDVTIETLRGYLEPARMRRLAQGLDPAAVEKVLADLEGITSWCEVGTTTPVRAETAIHLAHELMDLAARGAPSPSAYAGMRSRLGALLHGEFGTVFADGPQLELDRSLDQPGVTYISLPAMASNEDVRLMARVLIQDLKLIAHQRLTSNSGAPALLVLDEFAALEDPDQINDLLRQAREARISVVVSSQHLPDAANLQKALLGVGLVIAHQCATEDAQAVADLIGTYSTMEMTHQVQHHWLRGQVTPGGSLREVEKYVVHPNLLRSLPPGRAAVRLAGAASWIGLVDVIRASSPRPDTPARSHWGR
jgi:hypothetical protein